jgi:hypothetical protein
MNKNIIFITGKGATGKTFISKQYEKLGYHIISTDLIIKDHISNKFPNISPWTDIYGPDYNPNIKEAKTFFANIIKQQIYDNNYINIIVEGSIKDEILIKEIFGNDIIIHFVKPYNNTIYTNRCLERFKSDPDNYGNLWFIKDQDLNNQALKDYKNNNDKKIIKIINDISKIEYKKIEDQYNYYCKYFKVEIINN